jgi:hypothetical protein
MGFRVAERLGAALPDRYNQLEVLNVEHNGLKDQAIILLLKGASSSLSKLRCLNLSKNHITHTAAQALVTLLGKRQIEELYLSWNKLYSDSGVLLF